MCEAIENVSAPGEKSTSATADQRILSNDDSSRAERKGLAEKTVGGLHDAAFRELEARVTAPATVLDLGAGTGAWAARLLSYAYRVTCLDNDESGFAIDKVPFVRADLNGDFSELVEGKFDAVTAIEVIEHLENPTHFLSQCRELLSERGVLLVTTPNIECVTGRLRFLLDGNFRMFGRDERFNDPTHITPIQSYMFEKMSKAARLRLISHTTCEAGSKVSGRLARALSSVISPLVRGIKSGDNHIFTLTRL